MSHGSPPQLCWRPLAADFRTFEGDLTGSRQVVGASSHWLWIQMELDTRAEDREWRFKIGHLRRLSALVGGKLGHTLTAISCDFV